MASVQTISPLSPSIQPACAMVNVREAVGVFSDMEALNRAVAELDIQFQMITRSPPLTFLIIERQPFGNYIKVKGIDRCRIL